MPVHFHPVPGLLRLLPAGAAAALMLAACGGGGSSGSAETPAATAAEAASSAAAQTAAPASAPVAALTADEQLAAELAAAATASATTPAADAAAGITPAADDATSMAQAAGVGKLIEAAAVKTATPTSPLAATGRTFYIDSQAGNDSLDGLAATTSTATTGPWKTLARLGTATLQAGDTIKLACGSVWNETLKLPASGTAASPITVAAASAACATAPAIDGSKAIPPAAWTRHSGNIFKAALATPPLQMFPSAGYMTQAHHPNRGFDAANPSSLYLRAAADSDKSVVKGQTVSTYLVTGTDLVVPAGVSIAAGTSVRVRTNAYLIDESTVSSVSGNRLQLATPTTYAVASGWGYYLLGQLWMLDSAGEWHHDKASGTLYAWFPDSVAPASAVQVTQQATGVDLQGRQYVVIDGLTVRKVGVGVDLRSSTGITVRNSTVLDTADVGMRAAASVNATLSGNNLVRIGRDGVLGVDPALGASSGMQVVDSNLSDIGVTMSGESVLSLPVRTFAAIRPGSNARVSGNVLNNTGYIGIWAGTLNTVTGNSVSGACSVLDDCGAIYLSGAQNGSTLSGNLIQHARGAVAGKGAASAYTQAQGIYLDEAASGVTVDGNTVTDADNGIQLHLAANNVVRGNRLYGNRASQLWVQEDRSTAGLPGAGSGNSFTGNMVMSPATTMSVFLDSTVSDTVHFGSFAQNRYYDRLQANVVDERTVSSRSTYTMAQWKAANATRAADAAGWGASETNFAAIKVVGSNVVPNGGMLTSASGWAVWNQTAPYGSLVRESCVVGWCARYVAGGSAGIVSSPNFSVSAGTWYRLSLDVMTDTTGQAVDLVVRRGGGGSNGYESLSDRSLRLTASPSWTRYSVAFKATKSITANDPVTKDLGARIDVQGLVAGKSLRLANLELVPISPAEANTRSDLIVNPGRTPIQVACPVVNSQPALCANYARMSDAAAATWPYYLAAMSAEIVYTRDPSLVDSDGDGIPDSQDICPATLAGRGVNAKGCAIGQ